MTVAIIGGGIAGLTLALNLHERRIACTVYEAVPDVKEIGVGITLLPHATRELTQLGLQREIEAAGLETTQSAFFNRFGQKIFAEPRGRYAGYDYPEVAIHRGRLHRVLFDAAIQRLGSSRVLTGHRCVGIHQDDDGVEIVFAGHDGTLRPSVRADVAIGCDGVNSAMRRIFYPDESMSTSGINMWRGVTRHRPVLDGRSYVRIGSLKTGKLVLYPIVDDVDGEGNQLLNWVAEAYAPTSIDNDWNKTGQLADFLPIYQSWRYDWLDVPELFRQSESILEYPMADREPVDRWTFGRVTLAGDAAHPMYPRGSTGSAQSMIDARVLAECLAGHSDRTAALREYEDRRRETTSNIVRTNRTTPPDFINIHVEQLTGDKPFDRLEDHVSQDELRALSDRYKTVAGYALRDLR